MNTIDYDHFGSLEDRKTLMEGLAGTRMFVIFMGLDTIFIIVWQYFIFEVGETCAFIIKEDASEDSVLRHDDSGTL